MPVNQGSIAMVISKFVVPGQWHERPGIKCVKFVNWGP